MPIYDSNNTVVTTHVQSALSRPDAIKIKNRTLDGQPHIQTIGTGATLVDVGAYFTMEEKLVLDSIFKLSTVIKVTFDGRYYTGIIDDTPSWSRLSPTNGIVFAATFVLLVIDEGVV